MQQYIATYCGGYDKVNVISNKNDESERIDIHKEPDEKGNYLTIR